MNPLQESELEINEANSRSIEVISEAAISDAAISQSAVQTDGIVEMIDNRYSETETNRMEWNSILWQASGLIVTGVVVCVVFYYIS